MGLGGLVLGSLLVLYLKSIRILMFQLSGIPLYKYLPLEYYILRTIITVNYHVYNLKNKR